MPRLFLLACLVFPALSFAQPCKVPVFEKLQQESTVSDHSLKTPVTVALQTGLEISLPGGFKRVAQLPSGGLGFGSHPEGWSVGLSFENSETLSMHLEGESPAEFFRAVFGGKSTRHCQFLEGFQLNSKSHLMHYSPRPGVEIYAFADGGEQQFYLLREDTPDQVVTGLFKGFSRSQLDTILFSIKLD